VIASASKKKLMMKFRRASSTIRKYREIRRKSGCR